MSDFLSPSIIAKPLVAVAQTLHSSLRRVFQERQAGRMPFRDDMDLMERGLDETLTRIRGGNVDDTWWQNLSHHFGQLLITPDFLRIPAVQGWLAEVQVAKDVKALARDCLLGADPDDSDTRTRLQKAYAARTGEHEQLANGPIDHVVAILAAGYVASIPPRDQPLAGMVQANAQDNRRQFEAMQRSLQELGPDHYVVQAHSQHAERALSVLLKQRSILSHQDRVQQGLIALAQQVTDGDLCHAASSVRATMLYWAARVHATQAATLPKARDYLAQLQRIDPGREIGIIQALMLEAEGKADSALRALRDINTPDGRSALFATLYKTRDAETALAWFDEQPERDDAAFLTGTGWCNVAVRLAQIGRWEEALQRLTVAQEHVETWPVLAFVAGVVNAAMLFPVEWRRYALDRIPMLHPGIQLREGTEADRHRAYARACFTRAIHLFATIDQEGSGCAQEAHDWLLWLRLTDPTPAVAHEARQAVQEGMQDGQKAVNLMEFARFFAIAFDTDPLKRYLSQRARIGDLDKRELFADLLLAETSMFPGEYAALLEREEHRFSQVVFMTTLLGKRIEALVKDGQTVKARELLEAHKEAFVDHDYDRLLVVIDIREGSDPRARLEEIYSQTNALLDLTNLTEHLGSVGDWTALQPLLQERFRREPTRDNALKFIASIRHNAPLNSASILAFLDENQDLVAQSLDLTSERAWSLSYVGRWQEAAACNDTLLNVRTHAKDLALDINLAIQLGAWERFPVIISRVWPQRQALDPRLLLRLAFLAAEADANPHRAMELVQLAASKASEDAGVLVNAYDLAVQLGCEEQVGIGWLSRAATLSSDNGPVRQVSLRTIIEEMLPGHHERIQQIEQSLRSSQLPLHATVHMLNQPLSRFLLDLPEKNARQYDGRRRALLPIISGARQVVPMRPEWTIALDLTSIMVLHHLHLLHKTINAFRHVVLTQDTISILLQERRRVRFHQPSLVQKAEEIATLIDQGHLKTIQPLPQPPDWLSNEVGHALAELLEAARTTGGRVVHPYPIYKSTTFLEREAELREYAALILSTRAFTNVLFGRGWIDAQTHEHASPFLRMHDEDPQAEADAALLDRPVYFDHLAIMYLQETRILQAVCRRSDMNLLIHPSIKTYQTTLIEENRAGDNLAHDLDAIRVVLRDALEAGQATFMPGAPWYASDPERSELYQSAPTLTQILQDVRSCDAVCVDDRFVNRHPFLSDNAERTVPTICILDLLRYLEGQGIIRTEEKHQAFHQLRQAGYVLVPVESDELEKHMRQARIDQEGVVIESAEMRICRQTLMRVRSLDMIELPTETLFLDRLLLACMTVIHRLWADETISAEHAVALSDWIWSSLAPSPLDWARGFHESSPQVDIQEAFARHIALLLQPMAWLQERGKVFRIWVESEVLEPLLPANVGLVDRIAKFVQADIERLCEELSNNGDSATRGLPV